MKKLVALTFFLLIATLGVTWLYFKSLNLPGKGTSRIVQTIPADAALIFNFSNEDSFYEIYDSSALFTSLADTEQLHELKLLKQQLWQQQTLKSLIAGQPVYVSVHSSGDLLLTFRAAGEFSLSSLTAMLGQGHPQIKCTPVKFGKVSGVTLVFAGEPHPFVLIERGADVYSGSFSQALINQAARTETTKNRNDIALLNDQQQNNALANLYVNYTGLAPLMARWFKNADLSIIKPLSLLPASAALTLNYKKDALMFSGYTTLKTSLPATYLSLFKNQQPYRNQLKNVFPLITAYSTCFSVTNPAKFQQDLADWQSKAGLIKERQALFVKIKQETGVNFSREFQQALSNEFATLTTRFDEHLAIIQIKNGQALRPVLDNISTMNADSTGRFNYARLPYLLLGDAFSTFKQPYYTVIDNYLILANSATALADYRETYAHQNFLSRNTKFNDFNNLLAEQCNVCFYINYKNAAYIFRRDLQPPVLKTLYPGKTSAGRFLAGAYQLSGANNQFYTNFCMQLNPENNVQR